VAWTAARIAARVGGALVGDPERVITGVNTLELAGPSDLAFCAGGRWLRGLPGTRAGVVLLRAGQVPPGTTAILVRDPRLAYAEAAAEILPLYWPPMEIHPTASVHPSAVVEGAAIGAFAVVEAGARVGRGSWLMAHAYVGHQARIGEQCRIGPGASVLHACILGDRVWLGPGAVIGADGFGHVLGPGGPLRVPQLGIAVLEDDVHVGANACVDRAALDETRVGRGSRLDNLVQVAHGVRIGAECLLAAFAGVAGGAKLGNRVVMAGRTAVVDHIEVGDGAVFAGLASAAKDVPPGARIGGSPARNYKRWLREVAALRRLPELIRQVRRIQDQLALAPEAPEVGDGTD
jgi:UDP-3-O-[3-hydroxymyristoyl] glucosamine N-acyltransferase